MGIDFKTDQNAGMVVFGEDSSTGLPVSAKVTNDALHVYKATLDAGENQARNVQEITPGPYAYKNIKTATTTDISQNVGGYLAHITINGGTAGLVTIYDESTGGTTLEVGIIAAAAAATPAGTKHYNCDLTQGLQIVTAAATNITVAYLAAPLD